MRPIWNIFGAGRSPIPLTPMYLGAEYHRVARFLLSETPKQVESRVSGELKPELFKRDYVVLQFCRNGQPIEDAYIVSRKGTHYTTTTRPVILPDEGITVIEVPDERLVFKRLVRLSKALKRFYPHFYSTFKVNEQLTTIDSWYTSAEGLNTPEGVVTKILAEEDSRASVIDAALKYSNKVADECVRLHVPGRIAQKAIATLMFFALHPEPKRLQDALGTITGKFKRSTLKRVSVVPPMSIGFFLTHERSTGLASFRTAIGAARLLRRKARELRQTASASIGINRFHVDLHEALISYQAAHEIYSELRFIGKHVPSIWEDYHISQEEIQAYWTETEEARVILGASFAYAAGFPRTRALHTRGAWHVARPQRFLIQILSLLDHEGVDEAEATIKDLSIKLVCPAMWRDLALAYVNLRIGRTSVSWCKRLDSIIADWEAEFRDGVISGDSSPICLTYAYGAAAEFHRKNGQEARAEELLNKQRDLPMQVKKVLTGGGTELAHCHRKFGVLNFCGKEFFQT